MKRFTVLLPIAVVIAILVGLAADRWGAADRGLPSFTRSQPPRFEPLRSHEGSLSLRGTIREPGGAPVAEASIYLRSGGVPHWTYTDAEGAFALQGLFDGTTDAVVLAWGFPPETFRIAAGGAPVELVLPPRSEPPPQLPGVPRTDLTGRIRGGAAAWGDPGGYEVVLLPKGSPAQLRGAVLRRAATAADGSFLFEGLAEGAYDVRILPSWGRGGSWPDLGAGVDLVHPAGAAIDLDLSAGAVEGRLWTPSQETVEGALILVADAEDPRRVWPPQVTDREGSFRVRSLPPGRYLLSIRAGEGAFQIPVVVRAGEVARPELPAFSTRQE